MKTIFLCDSEQNFRSVYGDAMIGALRETAGADPVRYARTDVLAEPSRFAETEIIFSTWGMPSFSEEEIRLYFPKLAGVFYAAGSVQGFARPFLRRGVKVFSAWAANAVPVAEYTVSLILLANKGFFAQTRLMARKQLGEAEKYKAACRGNFRENVGLIGCGMIGSLVAEKLKDCDLRVFVYDPFLSAEKAAALQVTRCTLPELFSSCAVVSNHLANNAETRKMLRYEHFSRMRPYAAFLNTGRGAQVDEDGLVRILTERPDLTAVLDVTDPEPSPLSHPFYTLPNCFLTPHIAGSLGGEVRRMAEYMAAEYEQYAAGKPCRYEVTLPMLETMA